MTREVARVTVWPPPVWIVTVDPSVAIAYTGETTVSGTVMAIAVASMLPALVSE